MSAPKLRFLIVDPLEGVQVFARRLLESYGFEPARIHCCSDPVAALAQGFVEPPDFLLTDWLGNADPTGLQLYEQLRAQHAGCKVGFMSFQITPDIEAAAQAAGSRFLLKKPFDAAQLKQVLQHTFSWLAQSNPALMARVATESQGRLDPRQRRIELPPVPPPLRHGDTVRLNGRSHRVQAVVIRQGEQLAQLDGLKDLVPATRLSR